MFGLRKAKTTDGSFRCDYHHSQLSRKRLLLSVIFSVPVLSPAQQGGDFTGAYAAADAKHNAAYSQALPQFSPSDQEKLIRAELAWSNFFDNEKAFLNAVQDENRVSEDFVHSHNIAVVEARTRHLREFFVDNKIDYPPQYTPQNRDQALNKMYAECVRQMTASDQGLLQSSERAWITYRDAAIATVVATNPNQILKNAASVTLTEARIEQLTSIVQSIKQVPVTTTPTQDLPPPVQPSSPNPEDAKAVAAFQDEAKGILHALLTKKDDSLFKKEDAIKKAQEFPTEISSQISKLDAQYAALSNNPDTAKLLESAVNEGAVVKLLVSWSKFTQQIKAGVVADAELTMRRALSQQPKDAVADYLPFWQAAKTWQDVLMHDEDKYYGDFAQAQSLADAGKTSAAIKEYQAAYDLVENPTIPEKIKKLREQSLGL